MNIINQKVKLFPFAFKGTSSKQNFETKPVEENNKLENDMVKMSELGKYQINFQGGTFKLNPTDRLFISALATAFGLAADVVDKIKNVVADYLKTNNYNSMSDIGGENNINQQCDLTNEINNVIKLKGKDYERLVGKVIDRCDEGDNYFPYDDSEEVDLEEVLKQTFKNEIKKNKENDEYFIKSIAFTFGFNEKEQKALQDIFTQYMKEFNIRTLKNLEGIDKINETSVIIEAISREFDLSDEDETLITFELTRRIYANEDNYIPVIHPLDRNTETSTRDAKVLWEALSKYNLSQNNFEMLHLAMKQDAYENGFTSIFETFRDSKNQRFFTNRILGFDNFKDIKNDLLIDLFDAAKNIEKITSKLDSLDKMHSNKYIRHCAIVYTLDKDFNFSKTDIKVLKKYFLSKTLDLDNNNDIWKAAYELPDLINLPPSAGNKIAEVIKKVNEIPDDELLGYGLEYCRMIMSKK